MVVPHSPGDSVEVVARDEEGVEDAGGAVEADQGELVGQAHREGDVVGERETDEEAGGGEGEGVAEEGGQVGLCCGLGGEGGKEEEGEVVEEWGEDGGKGGKWFCAGERMDVG